MANPRLLRAAVVALALASSTGCTIGPIYARHVAGRIFDRETQQPIAGVEVFMSYEVYQHIYGGNSYDDLRWTTTDDEGRFEFAGHWAITRCTFLSGTQSDPDLRWLHPAYGFYAIENNPFRSEKRDWDNLQLVMPRDEFFINLVNQGPDLLSLCSNAVDCHRACEVWFGDSERCKRIGP
jgi:hypothetical protein